MNLQELLDHEAIRVVLYRYCRGVDRGDEQALRGAYWPDATDNHGAYSGNAAGFVDFALKVIHATEPGIHQMHNILIDLKSPMADVETYFSAWQQLPSTTGLVRAHQKGRYVDRFEKREGEWRIKARVVVFDWTETLPDPEWTFEQRKARNPNVGRHYPDDLIYKIENVTENR